MQIANLKLALWIVTKCVQSEFFLLWILSFEIFCIIINHLGIAESCTFFTKLEALVNVFSSSLFNSSSFELYKSFLKIVLNGWMLVSLTIKKHYCPKFFTWSTFELVSFTIPNSLIDSPSPIAARTLILVAKSVQNLANLVEFGAKVKTFWYLKISLSDTLTS